MKTTVQNNKNSGNFCIFFIQNSGNFYEKKQLLDVFFPRNSGNFCCAVCTKWKEMVFRGGDSALNILELISPGTPPTHCQETVSV